MLAFVCASDEERQGNGVLLDLSKGGCRIGTQVPLTVNDYYRLILRPIAAQPVTVETAVVCWRTNSECGLKFLTVEEHQEELLSQNLVHLR